MEAPGEKLLAKMWETLAEKGIGSLLKPWQIRREGKAIAQTQAESILLIAQAERAAEKIKHGTFIPAITTLQLGNNDAEKLEPHFDTENLVRLTTQINLKDTIRTEVNTTKAILVAESILRDETREPTQENIDADWLYRWRDYAGGTSSDELQIIWGKLLAGEVKAPGAFSLRTMEFVKNLSPEEATNIEKVLQFSTNNFIYKDATNHDFSSNTIAAFGIELRDLLELQNLGVVTGVEAFNGLSLSYELTSDADFTATFRSDNKCLAVSSSSYKKLVLKVFPLTSLGLQLLALCNPKANIEYLKAMGQSIKKMGLNVRLVTIELNDLDEDNMLVLDEEKI
jgi:hypothetical protein